MKFGLKCLPKTELKSSYTECMEDISIDPNRNSCISSEDTTPACSLLFITKDTQSSEMLPLENVSWQKEVLKMPIWLKIDKLLSLTMWFNMLIYLAFLVTFSFWWLHCLFPELCCFNLCTELSFTHLHLNISLQSCSCLIKSKEYVLCLTLKPTGLLVWALLTWVKIAGSDLHSSISLVRITHIRNAGTIFPSLIHIHVSCTLFSDLRKKKGYCFFWKPCARSTQVSSLSSSRVPRELRYNFQWDLTGKNLGLSKTAEPQQEPGDSWS